MTCYWILNCYIASVTENLLPNIQKPVCVCVCEGVCARSCVCVRSCTCEHECVRKANFKLLVAAFRCFATPMVYCFNCVHDRLTLSCAMLVGVCYFKTFFSPSPPPIPPPLPTHMQYWACPVCGKFKKKKHHPTIAVTVSQSVTNNDCNASTKQPMTHAVGLDIVSCQCVPISLVVLTLNVSQTDTAVTHSFWVHEWEENPALFRSK